MTRRDRRCEETGRVSFRCREQPVRRPVGGNALEVCGGIRGPVWQVTPSQTGLQRQPGPSHGGIGRLQ